MRKLAVLAIPAMLTLGLGGCSLFERSVYDPKLHETFNSYVERVEKDQAWLYDEEKAKEDDVYELEYKSRKQVQTDLKDAVELIFDAQRKGGE